MDARNDYYVYIMFLPDGRPCYVGKGCGGRWKSAFRAHNKHLARIIEKYGPLPTVKIRDGITEAEAFEAEIAFIAAIGRAPHDGPLVNLTNGGEGASGATPSAEKRERIRAALLGRKHSPERVAQIREGLARSPRPILKGAAVSEEVRAKMRAAKVGCRGGFAGRKHTPETLAKMKAAKSPEALARRGVPKNPVSAETRERLRAALTGRKVAAEARANMSASQKLRRLREGWK